jgi:peptidoglycan/xylan/chitin deacetylase (PgdA/CDA1 family)
VARRIVVPLVRDLVGTALYQTGLTRPARVGHDRLTIVTFHRVLPPEILQDYPIGEIAVSTDELAWFVDLFAREYTAGTLSELHRRFEAGERPKKPFLAITFDDGQLDNFRYARPLLEAAGLRASFFVPLDAIDGNQPLWHDRLGYAADRLWRQDEAAARSLLGELGPVPADRHAALMIALERTKALAPERRLDFVAKVEDRLGQAPRPEWDGMMSWDQLRELAEAGHEIGSHSLSHAILPLLDDAQLGRELKGSKDRLESELSKSCEAFCYPNGDADSRVIEATHRAGYRRAVTTAWGINPPGADPLRLVRCDLQGQHSRTLFGRLSPSRLAFRLSPYFSGPRP